MGIMDRNEPLIISHKFGYLPIRDPRENPVEVLEYMPSVKRNKAGEEFLSKYLAIVRTRLPREVVETWVTHLAGDLDDFIHLADDVSDSDDFFGLMIQGFSIAACEDSYFQIARPNSMSECAWEAMRSFTVLQKIEGTELSGQSSLNALLAGYLLAKIHKSKEA